MDRMYVTFCVDCSKGGAIETVNRIVRAFMKATLEKDKWDKALECLFTGCEKYEGQQFQRPVDMECVNQRFVMAEKMVQIEANARKKMVYPVFQAVDTSRYLSKVIRRTHETQITKMLNAKKSGDAVYTGLLLVIADGGAGLEHTGPDETAASKKLAAYCTGTMAEKSHIVPILIDLHGNAVNTRLKQLAAGFPDGYVRLGPTGRDEGDLCRCFSAILAAVNTSAATRNRRELVNAKVASELKELKNA